MNKRMYKLELLCVKFWFKDDDFKEGCKVWKYFNMM